MIAIVGLGNHEHQYHKHRHNVGFMFVDFLASQLATTNNQLSTEFKHDKYLKSEVLNLSSGILLAKPQTFMNLSGQAVSAIFRNYKLKIEDLIVIHDDLDIPLGKFRIDRGTGPKMHNGLLSIEQYLGTKDFWRVRIGIDNRNPEHHISGEAYVLNDFLPDERKTLEDVFPIILARLKREFFKQS